MLNSPAVSRSEVTTGASKPRADTKSDLLTVRDEFRFAVVEGDGRGAGLNRNFSVGDEDQKAAEAALRRKLDLYIVPPVALLYLFCFIDRSNIGNARLAGLEKDLHLHGYDFNTMLTIFYISYIIFDVPSNIACKVVGPAIWLPGLTLGFGITTIAMAFVTDLASISGVRFLLGLFEAGMLPGIAYYLSRWYRRSELSFRLAMYIVTAPLAGAFGGLLASAILTLDHVGSVKGWRMIFLIEGIITCGIAILTFFVLVDRPDTARFLTLQQRDLAVSRVKSERTAANELLDNLGSTKVQRGIFNPVVMTTAIIFLLDNVTAVAVAFFLPTIIGTIYPKTSVIVQQLYTVPPYCIGAVFTLAIPYASSRTDSRTPWIIVCAPLMMIGYIMFLASTNPHVRYGATFVIVSGAFPYGALCPAIASANVASDSARSSALATVVMVGTIGALASTWSFLPWDAPDYHIGNGLNLATSSLILIIGSVMWWWMRRDNRARESRPADKEEALSSYSQKELEEMEWKHPLFRWRP